MKPVYFDFTVPNLKVAKNFFEHVFDWQFEKFNMPYDYFRIKAGNAEEPGIDGGIGEIKDSPISGGRPLSQITIKVKDIDELIKKVKDNGGSIIEPKFQIPGIGCYATCAEPGGLMFGILQPDNT